MKKIMQGKSGEGESHSSANTAVRLLDAKAVKYTSNTNLSV